MLRMILASDQTVAHLILGIHSHMLSIHSVLPCTNVLLGKIGWLVLETFTGKLAEKDWISCFRNLPPLKSLLGKDSVPYVGSFCGCLMKKAEYLAREIIPV